MTKENLVTAPFGTTLDEAKLILMKHKIEKLPLVDDNGLLKGLVTIKDIEKGNGGVIYPELHYGRDALVGIGLILSSLWPIGGSAESFEYQNSFSPVINLLRISTATA